MENSEIIKNQFAWLQKLQVISKKPILIKAIEGAKPEGADIDLYAWIEFSSIWAKMRVPIYTRSILQNELCFDPDLKDWQALRVQFNKIVEYCQCENIPLMLAYSGGNGVHGHVFFDSFAIDTDNFESAKKYDVDLFKIVRTVLCDLILNGAGVTPENIALDTKKIRFSAFRKGSMVREFGTQRPDGNFKTLITAIPDQKPKLGSFPLIFPENIQLWKIPEKWNAEINETIRKEIEKSISSNQLNFDSLSLAGNTLEKFPCIKHLMKNGSRQRYYAAVSITLIGKQCGATWKTIEAAIKQCFSHSDITGAETDLRINNAKTLYTSDHHFSCRELKETFGADICDFSKCVICEKVAKHTAEAEKKQETTPDNIKQRAKEIAETGDPLQFILDTHQKLHVGDIETAKILLASIGSQSVLNSDGIQPKLSGDSGKGKSHCTKAMVHLIPKEYKLCTTLSDKAIYYADIRASTVVYSDDVNLTEGLEGIIKRASTNFQEGDQYTTVDSNRNKQELYIPQRVAWWFTSVDDTQSLQLLNRQVVSEVDETAGQDLKVLEYQRTLARNGSLKYPVTDDVLVCRELIKDIKEHPHRVKIPFVDAIKWNDMNNRRNFDIFLDIIKAFAAIRYKQREKDENNILIADLQDYRDAEALYRKRADTQCTKLNNTERKIINIIKNAGELGCDSSELQIKADITKGRLSQIMKGMRGKTGLLEKVKGLTVQEGSETDKDEGKTVYRRIYKGTSIEILNTYESVVSLDEKLFEASRQRPAKLLNSCQQISETNAKTVLNSAKHTQSIANNAKLDNREPV